MALLSHRIDEPERLRSSRVDGLSGQHELHRLNRVDQAGETHGAAETGVKAEHDLRKAEPRAFDCDSGLAGERNFEPTAQAEAMDHRDGWNFERLEPIDHRMRPSDRGFDRSRIGCAAKFVDVCS